MKTKLILKSILFLCMLLFLLTHDSFGQSLLSAAVSSKYFEREDIKFNNKFLSDFSYPTHEGKRVTLVNNHRINLKRDHPFVVALNWNKEETAALIEIVSYETRSKEYFDRLKMLMNDRGKEKFLKGFTNGTDQKSEFQRINLIKELDRYGVISALEFHSKRLNGSKEYVEYEPKQMPKYDFNAEKFIFKSGPYRYYCTYTYNVSSSDAAEIASNWTIYWEARHHTSKTDWTRIQVYINSFTEPLFSYNRSECK